MPANNETNSLSHIGLILLAAGGSTRMGRSKQLLPYHGRTLLSHAADIAARSQCRPIVVVLGYESARMATELEGQAVSVVTNPDWESGMGTSIRAGIEALRSSGRPIDAAVIMLCDQPLVTPEFIDDLAREFLTTGAVVVASEYGDAVGVPALFSVDLFPTLCALPKDAGAKYLIESLADEAARVIFPGGAVDIDTPEEYDAMIAETDEGAPSYVGG